MKKNKVGKIAEKIMYEIFEPEQLEYSECLAVLEMVKMWIISEYTMDFMKTRQNDETVDSIEVSDKVDEK
jgi:hypothetical protein